MGLWCKRGPLHKKKVDEEEGCSDEVVLVKEEIEDEECAPILNIFEILKNNEFVDED